ncbi:MAG TPA: type I glyceraldehyde-3-phosphate dehydrogenase [Thermoanaerobaculia bacterium]|nr:type I glyceraldehyde-3-phosphate dehydrogenase [Thermoanaerobaculia bacterium]
MSNGERRVRVGINGFGRIGRCAFKQFLDRESCEVVGINDLADLGDLAYLLKYDSVHGWYPRKVSDDGKSLVVDGQSIPFFSTKSPAEIPWGDLGAEIVVESSGAFRSRDKAKGHLDGGAKRVIVSAPSDDVDGTFVMGVNEDAFDPAKHVIVSMASCTTNCLAPVARVLYDRFGVEHLMLTTVHAYTSSQALMDTPVRKRRRGRAAALSIIPTTTGATNATEKVIPELAGRMDGMAFRVPVPDGSICDIVALLGRDVTAGDVNEALREAAEQPRLRRILRVTDEALVSQDIVGDTHSSIVDAESTMVLRDRVVKVLSWYDNEWGYSARLVDFACFSSTAPGLPTG